MISFSFMIFNYIIVYGDFMNKHIDTFHTIIEQSNSIVFFGGAGVSTESGIPEVKMAYIIKLINIHLKKF